MNVYELLLTTSLASGVIAAVLAKSKGRDPIRWFLIAAVLNVVGLVAVMVVQNRASRKSSTVTARL